MTACSFLVNYPFNVNCKLESVIWSETGYACWEKEKKETQKSYQSGFKFWKSVKTSKDTHENSHLTQA